MATGNTEELGIRINAQGVPETTAGVALTGKAVEDLGKKLDAAGRPLANAEAGIARTGKSAKEMQAAFRLLPAQITDVVTSLASGQPAWLVAIQQGGQIKDSFGGIVPAAKALIGAVSPVALALGSAAAAGGLLVLAHQRGAREAQAHARSLILTGNAAGTTANQMADAARAVSRAVGTQGQAAEAIAALAGTGEVARANLQGFTEVAVRMEKVLDQPLTDTASKFSELGRAPLEASLKLNRGLNYLTASTYEHIRALQAEGRMAEAGSVAQTAYAEAMNTRTKQVQENVGYLQAAWQGLGNVAKGAWDKMLDIGRDDTLQQKIDKLQKLLTPATGSLALGGAMGAQARAANEREFRPQLDALLEQQRLANRSAERQGRESAENREALRLKERAQVEAGNAISIAQAQAAATQQESLVSRQLAQAEAQAARREAVTRVNQATLQDLYQRDFVAASDYHGRSAALEREALGTQISLLDQQMAAERKMAISRRAVIDAQIAAEQRRLPNDDAETAQQQARLLGLNAERAQAEAQAEVRIIALKSQRSHLAAQQSAADVAAERAFGREMDAGMAQFSAAVAQRRQALSQFDEGQRDINARQAADLISDPYRRATEMAQLEVVELSRVYEEQLGGLRSRLPLLQIFQPDEAEAVQQQIVEAEQRKADSIVLINQRLGEQLKPQWQQMVESWRDTTRLMRESYDNFQTGWLQSGEDAWVKYAQTGKLSISSLKDFALGELGRLQFRMFLAEPMQKAGDGLAGLLGITKPVESAVQSAAISSENTARLSNTAALTFGTTALSNLATMASSAAAALASIAAGGGGGSGVGGLVSGLLNAFAGGTGSFTSVDVNGIPMTTAGQELPTRGGKAFGGAVARGSLQEINEQGLPEVLSVRGKTFLTMGADQGTVTPLRAQAGGAGGGGGAQISFAPVIHIDSRTDQAEVAALVRGAMTQAQAELLDMMERGQV